MTPRERVQLTLLHKEPDRVPIDLGSSRVTGIQVWAYQRLCQALGIRTEPPRVYDVMQMLAEVELPVLEAVGADVIGVRRKGPVVYGVGSDRYKPFRLFDGTRVQMPENFCPQADRQGNLYILQGDKAVAKMPYPQGHYFDSTEDQSLHEQIELPDIDQVMADWQDLTDQELRELEERVRQIRQSTDLAILFNWNLAGLGGCLNLPDWLVVVATEQQFVADYFQRQVAYNERNLLRLCQAIGQYADVIMMSGTDFGTQRGEMFDPQIFWKLYVPCFRRMNDVVHRHSSMKTFYHSCGSIRRIIPAFIQSGCDILNPVQCSAAGMDAADLKRQFGHELVFWGGGIDTQTTLPFGSAEQVRHAVALRVRTFAPGGGFVFNPVHNIQRDAPAENLLAMYETVRSVGRYPVQN